MRPGPGAGAAFANTPPSLWRKHVGDRLVKLAEGVHGDDIDRRLQAIHTQKNEAGFDPFGFDPDTIRYVLALLTFFYRLYFRTQVFRIDRVPEGRALFVANHSGQLPIDGMLIEAALLLDGEPPVLARSMVEKWVQRLPFAATLFPRLGQVLGAPDNARRLLQAEQSLLIFPEGARGISKPFSKRYRLSEFGLGFMRLALETKTPIVPVAVIGGEEQYPAVADLKRVARLLGMPAFPVLPQLLVGMALPLPTRYRIHFGEPMAFRGDFDEEDAEIEWRVEKVRSTIQEMVDRGLKQREHVFW